MVFEFQAATAENTGAVPPRPAWSFLPRGAGGQPSHSPLVPPDVRLSPE